MKRIFLSLFGTLVLLNGCGPKAGRPVERLRIGYQKWSTISLMKASGELAKSFEPKGIQLEWVEFPAGPPLLEALNAGAIDVGHTGDSPPLFAQAADIPFVYFAVSSASPQSSGVLVKRESKLHSPEDLRGRRIGFGKGTSANTMILEVLAKSHIPYADIHPVYLSPADGRVALEAGSIDAWAVWDPYLAAAEQGSANRALLRGQGYVDGREFYLASKEMAQHRPQCLKEFLAELRRVKAWAKQRPAEVNQFLARETGIPIEAVALAESRRNRYETQSVSSAVIASQQALADRYLALGMLPKKIDVKAAVVDLAQ